MQKEVHEANLKKIHKTTTSYVTFYTFHKADSALENTFQNNNQRFPSLNLHCPCSPTRITEPQQGIPMC